MSSRLVALFLMMLTFSVSAETVIASESIPVIRVSGSVMDFPYDLDASACRYKVEREDHGLSFSVKMNIHDKDQNNDRVWVVSQKLNIAALPLQEKWQSPILNAKRFDSPNDTYQSSYENEQLVLKYNGEFRGEKFIGTVTVHSTPDLRSVNRIVYEAERITAGQSKLLLQIVCSNSVVL